MSTLFTGGCACGAVRYQCDAEPLLAFNCHCRDCQRASGTAFAAILRIPTAGFTVTKGEPKFYTVTGNSGNTVSRGFCPACGSPLFSRLSGMSDVVGVRVGSLDDPSHYRAAMDIFVASAQPWDHMSPELPKFPGYPQGVGPK
ncbi:MAG: GFA family protein [Candidatus Binatia bacterium]